MLQYARFRWRYYGASQCSELTFVIQMRERTRQSNVSLPPAEYLQAAAENSEKQPHTVSLLQYARDGVEARRGGKAARRCSSTLTRERTPIRWSVKPTRHAPQLLQRRDHETNCGIQRKSEFGHASVTSN